mmetsp:Transcript_2746/g.11092  ORF Transcript_2746/g.11092 Transcript_2746/m.11092 type:complete len:216 (-) Transcript_2746:954-1601(-)
MVRRLAPPPPPPPPPAPVLGAGAAGASRALGCSRVGIAARRARRRCACACACARARASRPPAARRRRGGSCSATQHGSLGGCRVGTAAGLAELAAKANDLSDERVPAAVAKFGASVRARAGAHGSAPGHEAWERRERGRVRDVAVKRAGRGVARGAGVRRALPRIGAQQRRGRAEPGRRVPAARARGTSVAQLLRRPRRGGARAGGRCKRRRGER